MHVQISVKLGCAQVLFFPRKVKIIRNPLVHESVTVVSEPLEMDWVWTHAPAFAEFVEDLPVGMP